MNLAQLLVRAARTYPERPAMLHGDKVLWNYRELADRAARLAGHMRQGLGLKAGDRIGIYMTNHPCYLEVMYATWWAGLVVVPINAKLHAREVEYILDHAQARALFVTSDLADGLNPGPEVAVLSPDTPAYAEALKADPLVAAHRAPDDLAWLFYTSGTTGRPKGVMPSSTPRPSRTVRASTTSVLSPRPRAMWCRRRAGLIRPSWWRSPAAWADCACLQRPPWSSAW